MTQPDENRYGAKPVDSHRTGAVPGHNGPPKRSGGTLPSIWGTRDGGPRLHASGTPKQQSENSHQEIKIMQWNAEGISKKKLALAQKLQQQNIDVACIQETHLTDKMRFTIRGYQCYRLDRQEHKGGILILIKNTHPYTEIPNTSTDPQNDSEIQGISTIINENKFTIYNCYSPQNKNLNLDRIHIENSRCLVLGDFNSHSPSWGYDNLDRRGEEIEDWMMETKLQLIYDENDADTYFSRAWRTTSSPDLTFASEDLEYKIKREVEPQLGGSDHKPISITIQDGQKNKQNYALPRWNYKKARWTDFQRLTDQYTKKINCKSRNVDQKAKELTEAILKAANESIPRGARKDYIPLWTDELEGMNQQIIEKREAVENNPTDENMEAYKEAEDRFKKESINTANNAWKEKTENLDMDKNGNRLWNLIRAINKEPNSFSPPVLESEQGTPLPPKQTANMFLEHFQNVGDIQIEKGKTKEVKKEINEWKKQSGESTEVMDKRIMREELNDALKALQTKKSPGPDGISNEMLMNIGEKTKRKLLQIFNTTWKTGTVPRKWKEAIMIPIKKEGKPKNKPESYRPISLTSCICKLQERIINKRLLWHLESNNLIINEQAGFRKARSTEDQITYIAQQIEDSFQEGKKTAAIWVDMEKAFDRVWRDGLLLKLKDYNIKKNMFKWIQSYLSRRKARVEVQGIKSRQATIRQGVPQGGVLSPTLFLIFVNDIKNILCREVNMSMYADDLALLSSEKNIRVARERLQITLNQLEEWTKTWYMNINASKTTYTIFSLSPKKETINLKVGDHVLSNDQSPKYLGVRFDSRLTWKNQINECQKKGLNRSKLMSKLSGTTWGANLKTQLQTYQGYVRPTLEYGMAAWGTCSNAQMEKLNKVQNQSLRRITGGIKSTPITQMETICGIESLPERRDKKILTQFNKMKAHTKHPLHERTKTKSRRRLKRISFIESARKLENANGMSDLQIEENRTTTCPPWDRHKVPTTINDIPQLNNKTQNNKETKLHTTMMHIDEKYPKDEWIRIYTDGSASEATETGGAGVFIEWPNGDTHEHSVAAGTQCTNYKAEAIAIREGATVMRDKNTSINANIVFLTDAKQVLDSLDDPNNTDLSQTTSELIQLAAKANKVKLQWIPGHCGIMGNHISDTLSKMGAKKPQPETKYQMGEIKTLVKNKAKVAWTKKHPDFQKDDPIKKLNRKEQVAIFRLRTGHNSLKHHMFKVFKIGETDLCECGEEKQDASHVLQTCKQYQSERETIWPQPTALRTKLYGPLQELRKTAAFLQQVDLQP